MMRKVGLSFVIGSALVCCTTNGAGAASMVAFESTRDGNYEIYLMDPDGSNPTRLTDNPANDYGPSLSPDGSQVAFYSNRSGNYQLYVMNTDGSSPPTLVSSDTGLFRPFWSPNADQLAFYANGVGVMDADGTNRTQLTSDAVDAPVFSFDGEKIAFASLRDSNWEIYVMNADGSDQIRLTNNPTADQFPYFSPDGSQIAFTSAGDIWVMDSDGTDLLKLTDHPALDIYPTWSSDGTQILFNSERDGHRQIYVMDADGTNQLNLSNTSTSEFAPRWSMGVVPEPATGLLLATGLLGLGAQTRQQRRRGRSSRCGRRSSTRRKTYGRSARGSHGSGISCRRDSAQLLGLITLAASVPFVPSASLASTVYTTSIAGNTVNVHDTASNTTVTHTVPSPRFVTVDPITGQPYWNTENPRHMMTVTPGSAPEILFSTSLNANEIAVDHFSGHLYWAEQTTIKRANLDGTDPTTLVTGLSNAIGLDLDLSRGHLYFTEYNAGNIYRTNLDGSAQSLILSGSAIFGLEIDSESRHIYWTQGAGAGSGVYRSDIDGQNIISLITGYAFPTSIALDIGESHLYFGGGGCCSGTVWRANLDGSNVITFSSQGGYAGVAAYNPIPEPSTGLLLATGLLGLAVSRRRRVSH